MLNKMILIGYLGIAPESKKMNFCAAIFNFRITTFESYTDKNTNKKVDKTEWYSVVLFNPHTFGKNCSLVQNSLFSE